MRRFFIETWGCQMNVHDSQRMAGVLTSLGMTPAASAGEADIILLNSCSVREKPAEKVFDYLGRLKRLKQDKPDLKIGVCGCVGQQEQDRILARSPQVDFVLGPRAINRLADVIAQLKQGQSGIVECGFLPFRPVQEVVPGQFKSYLVISEGCDNYCSFCIVPYARGRQHSRALPDILAEAGRLARSGVKEIELLGQNVNSYTYEGKSFSGLLRDLDAIPGLRRLRFTTSHPKDFSQEIVDAMRELPSICPHIHLPVQSGSDRILERMNRKYSRTEYMEKVALLRRAIPHVAVATDIIVGFPGETEDDHAQTLSLLERIRYDSIFSFKYSPRPGTAASKLADDVPAQEKRRRLWEVQELQRTIQEEKNRELIGSSFEILVEGTSRKSRDEFTGRTPCNHVVNFHSPARNLVGQLVQVLITRSHPHSLHGELVERDRAPGGKQGAPPNPPGHHLT